MEASFNLSHTAVCTFRKLPSSAKNHLSVASVAQILRHRLACLSSLTYTEKCLMAPGRLAEAVQRSMRKTGLVVPRALVRLALEAEERYCAELMEEGWA
jgi:hypothetical protein